MNEPSEVHTASLRDASPESGARRTRVGVLLWRAALWNANWIGRVARFFLVEARAVTLIALATPTVVFWEQGDDDAAAIAGGVWLLGVLVLAAWQARNRLTIGDFAQTGTGDKAETRAPVDLADLMQVELSRLGDLFRVVGDRRAVDSGLGQQRALDATLTVDDLVKTLQGTISAETKASIGPVSVPIAPLISLFGRLLQAPRLSGSLHRDGDLLILTAQTSRRGGLSWRVPAEPGLRPADVTDQAAFSAMVEELALRVYTDLALGRAVRWEASKLFVEGLRNFRSCLRTPKDRKVNLKRTEELFLRALAEDEDFPLVYYNLGVVYTELHGLAVAAGRTRESQLHLSAAESSFGRAVEKDPSRWEGYFAFAQTQFHYGRTESVIDLCAHILKLNPNGGAKAKARELWARALVERDREGDFAEAVNLSRRAARGAMWALLFARLSRKPSARAEDDPESRCAALAAGCLLTYTDIFSRQMRHTSTLPGNSVQRWHADRIRRRVQSLTKLTPLPNGKAQLHFDFGTRALRNGHLEVAEEQLAEAARRDPTRPLYSAGLARARVELLKQDDREITAAEREEVVALCLRALQGMAGAFSPARDADACDIVADVYARLGDELRDDLLTARHLRDVSAIVKEGLETSVSGGSVSSLFLRAMHDSPIADKVGDYGVAAQAAQSHLFRGRELAEAQEHAEASYEFGEALSHAERATALNPLSTLAWETLGDIHRELSDFQNARIAWQQALATDPDNPVLYDKIGSSYWHLAFQGRNRKSVPDLEEARKRFESALLLYGSGSFEEQRLTHERLGKLNAALLRFDEARQHLEIVEAVRPPLVGWQQLGFGYLQRRNFSECEYYFGRVVREADALAGDNTPPDELVGDRLDEEGWPLALIRTWGHLGLAISLAERDGDLDKAERHLATAKRALRELKLNRSDPASDPRFPTRAPATVMECRGLIRLRRRQWQAAVEDLERAIGLYAHSRSYLELALALEQRAMHDSGEPDDLARALRLLEHGVHVGPTDQPTDEFQRVMDRVRERAPA